MLVARRKTRRGRKWAWLVLTLALLWPPLAWAAARALQVRVEIPHADALVVLAGSSTYVERTHLAARLFKERRAPVVLLTNDNEQGGWSEASQRNPFFVERAIDELVGAGVPRANIEVIPAAVTSTYDEAQTLREYAVKHNLRTLLIVTSAYHSRRALWTIRRVFRGTGVEVGLEPAAPASPTPSPALWWLSQRGWKSVAGEYGKLIYYSIHY